MSEGLALLVSLALIAGSLLGLAQVARSDLRRLGVGLAAIEEEFRPRAAEHQRLDEHAAGLEDDDGDGDGDGDGRRA